MQLTCNDLAHPTIAHTAFNDPAWLFEVKHDGFRGLVRKNGKSIDLRSRSGRALGPAFPELIAALQTLPDATLDGELLVPTADGRSDFEELRRRALLTRRVSITDASQRRPAVLVVFDVLEAD